MNILAIGDVVGSNGCRFLRSKLPALKKVKSIDLTIANGENSADGNGITRSSAEYLLDSGVDVITLGNHSFRRQEIYEYLDNSYQVIRPANFPKGAPGSGVCVYDMGRYSVCVINLMGQVYLDSVDCPFAKLDEILNSQQLPKIRIVDFHGEATGEKRAFGYYADGRVSAVFGTHTHVQTADEYILPKGTGYISDVGMTGTIESVLGVQPELVIRKCMTKMPVRFDLQPGPCKMDCVIFQVDESTGLCENTERISLC